MIFSYFIPFRKKRYVLNLSEKQFLEKLRETEAKLKEEYQPGKYYYIHDPESSSFIFKNIKFNTSKESGVISKFRYSFAGDKTIIKSSFRYASAFYFFLIPIFFLFPFAIYDPMVAFIPLGGYALFCFFLHLEAWVVSEEFKTLFEKEIISPEDLAANSEFS